MTQDSSTAPSTVGAKRGIGLFSLIALVVSSSIGSGVFALSTDISAAAAPGPALIAWAISGIGFMALAASFGRLSILRPDLNGIVAYAKEGFGPFVGFVSGWGYWLSIWIGNVAFGVMLATAIGYFYPPFSGALTVGAVAFTSLLNWVIVLLVNRGVEEASVINAVVMACKLIPIFSFIVTMAILFDPALFTADFWGNVANNLGGEHAPGSIPTQITKCFMVMMWVFVGMEGASVLGHRARKKSDVSRATILGCTALVAIYVAASVLPYGFLSREELIALDSPSMPYIFQRAVGSWGGAFISAGLIISIFGAWLSYTILASEAMREMAKMRLLPRVFARLNTYGAPTACLITTGTMIQVLSIIMLFSKAAYQFAYSLCTASIVISWGLAAAYMARYAWTCIKAGEKGMLGSFMLGTFATAFLVVAIALSGIYQLMLCCIAYVPGIAFYAHARREYGETVILTGREKIVAAIIAAAALAAVIMLATGAITI